MTKKEVSPENIHLTPSEKEWLVKLATSNGKRLSAIGNKAPKRTMNGLVKSGTAKLVEDGVWELTEIGQRRCTNIY